MVQRSEKFGALSNLNIGIAGSHLWVLRCVTKAVSTKRQLIRGPRVPRRQVCAHLFACVYVSVCFIKVFGTVCLCVPV